MSGALRTIEPPAVNRRVIRRPMGWCERPALGPRSVWAGQQIKLDSCLQRRPIASTGQFAGITPETLNKTGFPASKPPNERKMVSSDDCDASSPRALS